MSDQQLQRSDQRIMTHQQHMEDLRGGLSKIGPQLDAVLPKGMSVKRLLRIAATAAQKTPQLLDCDRHSFYGAVVQCAQMGLEPDLGHAYLVPLKRKVNLWPGYKGLLELARRSAMVMSVNAGVAHVTDEFEWELGSSPFVRLKFDPTKKPGEVCAAWATAELRGATTRQVAVVARWELDEIKSKSSAAKAGISPWTAPGVNQEAMMTKTAIKRLSKTLPSSVELRTAVALDDAAEMGEEQKLDEKYTQILEGEMEILPPDAERE